ncbi:MAG: hypothetical protein PUI72_07015 [Prevotellaceae bacterium]|nr:hypothetical protein [Prevotellaceae bacterium]MDY6199340.1 hypothetical protein [Prevotella sp.]
MKEKVKGSHNDCPNTNTAKVDNSKDITKVLVYFRYKVATTLDAALDLGMLRNSITWYVRDLEEMGLLQVICKRPDTTTGYKANYYSANPSLWIRKPQQLSLFTLKEMEGSV